MSENYAPDVAVAPEVKPIRAFYVYLNNGGLRVVDSRNPMRLTRTPAGGLLIEERRWDMDTWYFKAEFAPGSWDSFQVHTSDRFSYFVR